MINTREELQGLVVSVEYYEAAYVGEGAPFRERQPSADELCRLVVRLAELAGRLLAETREIKPSSEISSRL